MVDSDRGETTGIPARTTIQSVETTFAIVTELERRGEAGVTELAEATGLSKSSVYKHLLTLLTQDFVVKDGDTYSLGFRFLDIGGQLRDRTTGSKKIKMKLQELANRVEESAQFAVEEHGYAVVLFREMGRQGVFSKGRVGKRFHMHTTAGGKAILSQLPDDRVREILDRHGLPRSTDETITDEAVLFEELATIRSRGVAFNMEESTDGLRAVGIPVTNAADEVLGAFAVAGPTHRIRGDKLRKDIPDVGRSIVNELELNLAYA